MTVQRFFVAQGWLAGEKVLLHDEVAHRISNVMRLEVGEKVVLLDNSGWEYKAEILSVGATVEVRLGEKRLSHNEPEAKVWLFISLLKGDKFDLVLQKATELGVVGFFPVLSSRCIARDPGAAKVGRWQAVIREAAEQSRRGRLPVLHPVMGFDETCRRVRGVGLIPWEGEETTGLAQVLPSSVREVSLFIGPEGGYSAQEIEGALAAGIKPISLGPRILRAETAAISSVAALMYHLGELAPRKA